MNRHEVLWTVFTALACSFNAGATGAQSAGPDSWLILRDGWTIQSSAKVAEKGEKLSTVSFTPQGWYSTQAPSTVMAALVENKVYPDPYFGMNLRLIPGTTYKIGENFSNLPMPEDSPFRIPWWYRNQFRMPASYKGKTAWLHFDGINFRANIWLNGHEIAASDQVAGTWRLFDFNVTGIALPGEVNTLAVEVFPPQPNDLAFTWVDWNPMPPDKDMGIWRSVYVTPSGPVALRYPQVITHLDMPSLETAHLTLTAELLNISDRAVRGNLKAQIGSIELSQPVELAAKESKLVTLAPENFAQLHIRHPRLWWPAPLGPQDLYELHMEFESGGQISDQQDVRFGIREVTSELGQQDQRIFKINGKNILIRGAGWAPDMLLRSSPERQEAEIRYVRDMNLNTIRLEGKLEDEYFLSLCDRYGILVQAGWCCCDHWERWKRWKGEDHTIAAESLRDQLRRLRNHACVFDWLYGSDNPPPPNVEQVYLRILKEERWPNPYQSSATEKRTSGAGHTGLKMTGPYEYVAPSYWLEDTHERGGAHGFNTETSPGAAVPPVASLRQMLGNDHLWPINEVWNFHAGGGEFKTLEVFTRALNTRYGKATGVEDYAEKAQVMTYEAERAMFEAYGRNKYISTGVIQWMLNNAWPSLIWHLYDYYLRPGGGYFGTKKACESVHVQYSYDNRSIVVVNSLYEGFKGYKLSARVYNLDLAEKFSKGAVVDIPPDSSMSAFTIPELDGLTRTYFVCLALEDPHGKRVSSNFYWLSTKPDVSDWDASTWYYTPIRSYADFTSLQDLPKVNLKLSSIVENKGSDVLSHVRVENPSEHLAFFVHLRIRKGKGGEEVLPVLWEENYFPLMPGEKAEVTAACRQSDLQGAKPVAEVDGWNVPPALEF
jgi:exo-1,4-beta-D-glucosaminidase